MKCCYESINKRVIATFLSFGKLDSLFFSTAVLPKFSEFYFSVYFYFYLAIIILTSQYFMTLRSSSSLNLVLLKFIESKISTNWILFGIQCGYFCGLFSCLHISMVYSITPQLSELFLFPTFKQDSRNIEELHTCGFYSHLKHFFF